MENRNPNLSSEYGYGLKVWFNGIRFEELCTIKNFAIDTIIGGRVPMLYMSVLTSDLNAAHLIMSETTSVYLEISGTNEEGKEDSKDKYCFFVSESHMKGFLGGISIDIVGLADLSGKASLLGTPVKVNKENDTYKYIKMLFDEDGSKYRKGYQGMVMFGNEPEGFGKESKINILDMLSSKSSDNMVRNFSGVSKLEAINEVISSSKIDGEKTIGHFFAHNRKTGVLELTLFDLEFRCQRFQPKTFKYQGHQKRQEVGYKSDDGVPFETIELEKKSSAYTSTYWDRGVESYANDEVIRFVEKNEVESMFSDGMPYPKKDIKLGKGEVKEFPLFRSGLTLKRTLEPTVKETDRKISSGRANHMKMTKALQKINVMAGLKGLVQVDIGDIWIVKFPDYTKELNSREVDKLFSGRYMVTRVIVEYQKDFFKTTVIFSRDSYVKG